MTARKAKATTEVVELPHGLRAVIVLRDKPIRRRPKPPPDPTLDEEQPW